MLKRIFLFSGLGCNGRSDVLSVDWVRDGYGDISRLDQVEVTARWPPDLGDIFTADQAGVATIICKYSPFVPY